MLSNMDFSIWDIFIDKWDKTDLLYGLSLTLYMWITRGMLNKILLNGGSKILVA